MKFKALVEYEYPIEHKPPVKAEIVLHGDRVVTDNIKGIEQEPCNDAISRQAVIDELNQAYNLIDAEHRLKGLTPVTPQQKMGRWIDDGRYAEGHNEHAYRCSECDEHYIGYAGEFKYCPNCGSYNGGETEE